MNAVLSPEQQAIMLAYTSPKTLHVKYIDLAAALGCTIEMIGSSLQKGKPIAIIVDNETKKQAILSALRSKGWDQMSYEVNSFAPLSDGIINLLRAYTKDIPDVENIVQFHLNQERIASMSKAEAKRYHRLYTPIHGEYHLQDILNFVSNHQMTDDAIDLSDVIENYSKEHFYKLKSAIEKISKTYEDVFDLFSSFSILNADNEDLSSEDILTQVGEYVELSTRLNDRYNERKKHLLTRFSAEQSEHNSADMLILDQVKKEIVSMKVSQNINPKSGGFSLIKKKTATVDYVAVISNAISKLSTPYQLEQETLSYEEAISTLDYLKDKITQRKSEDGYGLRLSRINKLNTNDEIIQRLDFDLNDFIAQLNDSGLFSEHFENNALSLIGQQEIIGNIREQLAHAYTVIRNYPHFMEWMQSKSEHSKEIMGIVDKLRHRPKAEWSELFKRSYFTSLVAQYGADIPESGAELDRLTALRMNQAHTESDYLAYQLYESRQNAMQKLKSDKKSVYQYLYKKNNPSGMTFMDLYQQAHGFIDAFFPIHIYSRVESNISDYEMIFNYSDDVKQVEKAINFSDMEHHDFSSFDGESTFPLYLNEYNYDKEIEQLSNIERLKAGKKLAKMMLSVTQNIKLYQLKYANIISTLSPAQDALLLDAIKEYGVKELKDSQLYDRLTESLIETSRRQFLITQDGLLSASSYEDFLWQHKVIDICRQAGVENINIWSAKEYHHPELIRDLMHGNLFREEASTDYKASEVEAYQS